MVPLLVATMVVTPLARAEPESGLDGLRQDAEVDAAIERGLEYLAKTQHPEGYWPSAYGRNVGVTGIACMAFLAAGYLPGDGRYGAELNRAIDWIVGQQHANGLIVADSSHGPMYCHGIATLLLCEVGGMCTPERDERIRTSAAAAVRLILLSQRMPKPDRHAGGWRYKPQSIDSDLSVTGWQLLALKAAANNGADVPEEAITAAVRYVKECEARGGGFGYMPGDQASVSRAGLGILCLEIAGKHLLPRGDKHHAESVRGGDWLLRNIQRSWNGQHFYYGVYYGAMGMWQLGGTYWQTYWPQLRRLILANQREDGSWPIEVRIGAGAGPAYSTGMTLLALCVEKQLLPIYQR